MNHGNAERGSLDVFSSAPENSELNAGELVALSQLLGGTVFEQ